MKKVCIIGGQLQGLEATYLAKRAGFETVVIDKESNVPASFLTDEFINLDLLATGDKIKSVFKSADLVLPATENFQTLVWLKETAAKWNYPLALDLEAYKISSSKIESNYLFANAEIAMPKPWPECGFPIVVKPSALSGSQGVRKIDNQIQLNAILQEIKDNIVIQEYLVGPSFSLEVIGHKGSCMGLQVTELQFDAGYDCKRVLAGPEVGLEVEKELHELGAAISKALNLSGIMDIEVIAVDNKLKILEIDARLPSQTPTVVFHSSDVNMVEILLDYWTTGKLPKYQGITVDKKAVIYEHLEVREKTLAVTGEHCLVGVGNLKIYENIFGAKTIISNFADSPGEWVATVVFEGKDIKEVWDKRKKGIELISKEFKIKYYQDFDPFG